VAVVGGVHEREKFSEDSSPPLLEKAEGDDEENIVTCPHLYGAVPCAER